MERILSQEEISELLAAVQQEEGPLEKEDRLETRERGRDVAKLDLLRVPGAGRRRLANFDIILDGFARNYGISLTNRLQRSVSVRRKAMETMEFECLLQELSGQGSIGIVRLDPLRYGGLIIYDRQICFSLVEILLGGAAETRISIPERPLTAIETNIIRDVITDACGDFAKAMRAVMEINATLIKLESNPRLVTIVPPEAIVFLTEFEVTFKEFTGTINLVIPLTSLEPVRDKLREGSTLFDESSSRTWAPHLYREFNKVEMNVSAQMAEITLRVRDLLNLQVGDIVELGTEPDTPVRVKVENKSKFLARPGARNGNKAVQVVGPCLEDE